MRYFELFQNGQSVKADFYLLPQFDHLRYYLRKIPTIGLIAFVSFISDQVNKFQKFIAKGLRNLVNVHQIWLILTKFG